MRSEKLKTCIQKSNIYRNTRKSQRNLENSTKKTKGKGKVKRQVNNPVDAADRKPRRENKYPGDEDSYRRANQCQAG